MINLNCDVSLEDECLLSVYQGFVFFVRQLFNVWIHLPFVNVAAITERTHTQF